MSKRLAFRDILADYFARHEGEWINGLVLARLGGVYAWRTRVSDCRRHLGMQIDNRQAQAGPDSPVVSEYRYTRPLNRLF